jgi:hypothetical protein
MPAGELVTVPVPVPLTVTFRGKVVPETKVAVTFLFAFMVRLQVFAVPVQSPDHWEKLQPDAGFAVRVTLVPEA